MDKCSRRHSAPLRRFSAALLCLVLAALLASSLSGCSSSAEDKAPDGMKLASTSDVSYTMYVPQAWTVDISTGVVSAYVSESDRSSVSMTSFNLDRDQSNIAAKDFWDTYKTDLTATFPDMAVVSEGNYVLDGTAAYQCVYTATVTGTAYQFMQIVCPHGGYMYIFTYTAFPAKYDANTENVTLILDNFKFGSDVL